MLCFISPVYALFYHSALLIHVFDPPFHISPYGLTSAIWCTTMEPKKLRNQRNNAETPKSCFQKN